MRHTPGSQPFANEYHVQFKDCTIKWDPFRYPLEEITGILDIYPEYWEFHDFRGTHHGGTIVVSGGTGPRPGRTTPPGENGLVVEIAGQDVALDADLHEALKAMRGLATAWETSV